MWVLCCWGAERWICSFESQELSVLRNRVCFSSPLTFHNRELFRAPKKHHTPHLLWWVTTPPSPNICLDSLPTSFNCTDCVACSLFRKLLYSKRPTSTNASGVQTNHGIHQGHVTWAAFPTCLCKQAALTVGFFLCHDSPRIPSAHQQTQPSWLCE